MGDVKLCTNGCTVFIRWSCAFSARSVRPTVPCITTPDAARRFGEKLAFGPMMGASSPGLFTSASSGGYSCASELEYIADAGRFWVYGEGEVSRSESSESRRMWRDCEPGSRVALRDCSSLSTDRGKKIWFRASVARPEDIADTRKHTTSVMADEVTQPTAAMLVRNSVQNLE